MTRRQASVALLLLLSLLGPWASVAADPVMPGPSSGPSPQEAQRAVRPKTTVTLLQIAGITGTAYLQGRKDHSGAKVRAEALTLLGMQLLAGLPSTIVSSPPPLLGMAVSSHIKATVGPLITILPPPYEGFTTTDGTYLLSFMMPGTYTVTITMPGYLWAGRDGVAVKAEQVTTLPPVTLLGGDANNNGVINIQDLVIIAVAFNTSPGMFRWDPRADINGDSKVNVFDLVLAASNLGKRAPSPWP